MAWSLDLIGGQLLIYQVRKARTRTRIWIRVSQGWRPHSSPLTRLLLHDYYIFSVLLITAHTHLYLYLPSLSLSLYIPLSFTFPLSLQDGAGIWQNHTVVDATILWVENGTKAYVKHTLQKIDNRYNPYDEEYEVSTMNPLSCIAYIYPLLHHLHLPTSTPNIPTRNCTTHISTQISLPYYDHLIKHTSHHMTWYVNNIT